MNLNNNKGEINMNTFYDNNLKKNILSKIAILLIVIFSNTSLYAGTQLGGSVNNPTSGSIFVPTINPIFTETLRSVSTTKFISNDKKREYHTYEPGKEPLIYIWTIFPGPKSNVTNPKVVKSLIGLNV
jgi:hypothetical protein